MAIYVGETSFAQLERATDQAKAMINSWTTESTTFKDSHQNFNPSIPVTNFNYSSVSNHSVTQKDYENYLWLFGGRRV